MPDMPILPPFNPSDNAEKLAAKSTPSDTQPPVYNNANVDESALARTLEGIAEIGHYFEIVYTTDSYPSGFTLAVFPAIRVIFRSGIYTIARCYLGDTLATDQQWDVVSNSFGQRDGYGVTDYTRVHPLVSQEEKEAINNGE